VQLITFIAAHELWNTGILNNANKIGEGA